MIRFARPPEPARFEQRVRTPGGRWLARRRPGRLPDYWREVLPELQEAFHHLCAYSLVWLSAPGEVDHFVPTSRDRALAYEWSNYRYAAHWLNAAKQDLGPDEVLDPFEVEDGWFEIQLPSCQMLVTEACPPERRAAAETMLKRLHLCNGNQVMRFREMCMEEYRAGNMDLKMLARWAPLLARAVRKEQEAQEQAKRKPRSGRPKPRRRR